MKDPWTGCIWPMPMLCGCITIGCSFGETPTTGGKFILGTAKQALPARAGIPVRTRERVYSQAQAGAKSSTTFCAPGSRSRKTAVCVRRAAGQRRQLADDGSCSKALPRRNRRNQSVYALLQCPVRDRTVARFG